MNLLDTASLVVTPNGYKASKLYSIIPSDGSGDMPFARTGDTATRVNSSGLIETVLANKPRLDYLGSTCPKLLIEPQRTNLLTYSDDFDNAAWTKLAITISANSVASPDGTTNADTFNTTNAQFNILRRTVTTVASTVYTASFFVKKNNYRYVGIRLITSGDSWNFYDFDTNTVSNTNQPTTPITATNYGNGWVRLTITATASGVSSIFDVGYVNSSGANNATAAGTEKYYVYGAQLEASAYVTSYIPTTTASVTRNADSCEKTSATALIGQTEGTMFINLERLISNVSSGTIPVLLQISDGTINNRIFIGQVTSANKFQFYVVVGGTAQLNLLTIDFNLGRSKIAIGYKSNDFVIYVNGVQVYTSSSISIPTCSKISIGGIAASTEVVHPISSVALWKTRLQNAELATLTTL